MPAWWNRCCAHWVSCSHPRRPSWRRKPKESCMNEAVAVMNDQGLAEICRLLEREDMLISPDAVWLSSRPGFYGHLLALDAIAVSRARALAILCPDCGTAAMRPPPHAEPDSQPDRRNCPECGWARSEERGEGKEWGKTV